MTNCFKQQFLLTRPVHLIPSNRATISASNFVRTREASEAALARVSLRTRVSQKGIFISSSVNLSVAGSCCSYKRIRHSFRYVSPCLGQEEDEPLLERVLKRFCKLTEFLYTAREGLPNSHPAP